MKLKDLCGKHIFSGCELTVHGNNNDFRFIDTCHVCLFTLDEVTYVAVEDPDDGYRSYCNDLEISEVKPKYSFPGVEVECSMKNDTGECGWIEKNDILVIRDLGTGKVILEVGTANINDYYPYCHFEYHPENMKCNQNIRLEEVRY